MSLVIRRIGTAIAVGALALTLAACNGSADQNRAATGAANPSGSHVVATPSGAPSTDAATPTANATPTQTTASGSTGALDNVHPDSKAPNPCSLVTPADVQNILHVSTTVSAAQQNSYALKRGDAWWRACLLDHAPAADASLQVVSVNIAQYDSTAAAQNGYNAQVQQQLGQGYKPFQVMASGFAARGFHMPGSDGVVVNFNSGSVQGFIMITGLEYPNGDYVGVLNQLANLTVARLK